MGTKEHLGKNRGVTVGKMKELKTVVFLDSLLTEEQTVLCPAQGENYL